MTSIESLYKFGTVAFGIEFMTDMITMDGPQRMIECYAWFRTVPACYRDEVVSAAQRTWNEMSQDDGGIRATDEALHAFVHGLHHQICAGIEPR